MHKLKDGLVCGIDSCGSLLADYALRRAGLPGLYASWAGNTLGYVAATVLQSALSGDSDKKAEAVSAVMDARRCEDGEEPVAETESEPSVTGQPVQ